VQLSERVITQIRGEQPKPGKAIELIIVDDDASCPPLHPRSVFSQSLEVAQVAAPVVDSPTAGRDTPVCVAVFGELRDARHDVAYRAETVDKISAACDAAVLQRRPAFVVLFAPPVLASQIPRSASVVCAWSGDRCMQEAAARWLTRAM
jgi:hypothetical protein